MIGKKFKFCLWGSSFSRNKFKKYEMNLTSQVQVAASTTLHVWPVFRSTWSSNPFYCNGYYDGYFKFYLLWILTWHNLTSDLTNPSPNLAGASQANLAMFRLLRAQFVPGPNPTHSHLTMFQADMLPIELSWLGYVY